MTIVSGLSMPKLGIDRQDITTRRNVALGGLAAVSVVAGGAVGARSGHPLLGLGIGAAVAAVGAGAALLGSASHYDPYPYPYVPEPGWHDPGWSPDYDRGWNDPYWDPGYPDPDSYPPGNSWGDDGGWS